MEQNNILLSEKYLSLIKSDFVSFTEIAKMKNIMGVYIAYSENENILYIGSTNKFNIRFGTDLKHESTHTLMKKILRHNLFPDRMQAKDYLVTICKFKIEKCSTKREAEALEHFAIWVLNPTFNK